MPSKAEDQIQLLQRALDIIVLRTQAERLLPEESES
jgi:hypothetical protein